MTEKRFVVHEEIPCTACDKTRRGQQLTEAASRIMSAVKSVSIVQSWPHPTIGSLRPRIRDLFAAAEQYEDPNEPMFEDCSVCKGKGYVLIEQPLTADLLKQIQENKEYAQTND